MSADAAPVPRGVRNNNPGNLIHSSRFRWAGEQLPPDGPYCRFDLPFHGLRALAKNLRAYETRDGCDTLAKMVTRFAPPEENATAEYIADVEMDARISRDDKPGTQDDNRLSRIMAAIIKHENRTPGVAWVSPYTDFLMNSAIRAAGYDG